jgi:hypothetical protein
VRRTALKRGAPPQRRTPLVSRPREADAARVPLPRKPLERHAPIRPVSKKQAAKNRRRRAVIAVLYPDRPLCSVPWCPRFADDIHEPLTRGRGGAIDDAANMAPLCRSCHDVITFTPESELGWAYEIGLLQHSWPAEVSP